MVIVLNVPIVKHQQGVAELDKMGIESITDVNYQDFKKSSRAALVVGASWCKHCKGYYPTLDALSNKFPFIKFGKAIIDKDRTSQLKRDYSDLASWLLPTTLLFKDQREISRIKGVALYPDFLSKLQEYLILGSTVFIPDGKNYIPGVIKHINNNSPYLIQLTENSPLGKKGANVQLREGEFNWGIE